MQHVITNVWRLLVLLEHLMLFASNLRIGARLQRKKYFATITLKAAVVQWIQHWNLTQQSWVRYPVTPSLKSVIFSFFRFYCFDLTQNQEGMYQNALQIFCLYFFECTNLRTANILSVFFLAFNRDFHPQSKVGLYKLYIGQFQFLI